MKIARVNQNGQPVWVGSEDGNTFYKLQHQDPFCGELDLDVSCFIDTADWLVPVEPPQIFAIGLNYRKHAAEFSLPIPDYPVVFLKSASSVQCHGGDIVIPQGAKASFVDYEVELAVVIGKTVKDISVESAFDAILGYTIANDVTSRDWQKNSRGGGQWCRSKSFDTFCPLGPWVVTKDEITDPDSLEIETRVNGELRQKSNTSDMIFNIAEMVSFLSQGTTLLPGTIILTGTPSGVGAGLDPRKRLAVGDEVSLTIESIGTLTNRVSAT